MTGLPIVLAVAAAALAASALRLPSLATTLVAAYLFFVGQAGLVTWALSPSSDVTTNGLTVAEVIVFAVALAAWWLRGRPGPDFEGARSELRLLTADRLTLAFLVVLGVALVYELVLAVTVPVNNWDSLTYHLPRVAAWHQAHGIHWIANAPTGRMNEFQPLAEQQILFLFTGAGTTALFALPQYVAELAILIAIYSAARRLGYDPRLAARGTTVAAMLSLVALEATTAQNDLVAAAFPIAAASLLLAGSRSEEILAGFAVALGLGTKLTTALTLPVLAWLAWPGGRRTAVRAGLGLSAGLLAVGAWSYVLNLSHTGHLLGHGQGRVEDTASFSISGTVTRFLHIIYRLFDLTVMPHWLIFSFAALGASAVALLAWRKLTPFTMLPLFAPVFALAVIDVITGQDPGNVPRAANEDFSSFGPIGTVVLIAAPVAGVLSARADRRRLAFALALPSFMLLLALEATYNVWIMRFLVVPAVLTAPLFAGLCRSRNAALALLAVGGVTLALVLTDDANKKLNGSAGMPWTLSQAEALDEFPAHPTGAIVATALRAYDAAVPKGSCVGAVLDPDEPSYLLWGPGLDRRVVFLPSLTALDSADRAGVDYVVVSTGVNAPVSKPFAAAGWVVKPLGSFWQLAIAPAGRPSSVLTTC